MNHRILIWPLLLTSLCGAQEPKRAPNTVDHAGIIQELGPEDLKRGKEIYATLCTNCHGADGKIAPLEAARAFGADELQFGEDPFSMFKTLTYGNGMMGPQTWMTPKERYSVIHYIREAFMKPLRADFVEINDGYLEGLPTVEAAPEDDAIGERDFGPALASQLTKEISSVLSIDLGDDTTISYNLHTLDQAGLWEGGFLNLKATQHYRERGGGVALPDGKPIAGLGGWNWAHDGTFDYPKEGLLPRGPMPAQWLTYQGHYLHENRVTLSYSIDGRDILESPTKTKGYRAIRHSFRIGPGKSLRLSVAQFEDPSMSTQKGFLGGETDPFELSEAGRVAVIRAGSEEFVAATVTGQAPVRWSFSPDNRLILEIPAAQESMTFEIHRTAGAGGGVLNAFVTYASSQRPSLSPVNWTDGGALRWPDVLQTAGVLGNSDKAYTLDTLTLPEENPWNVWFRTSALAFFPDGRMVISTHGGDVWIVDGVDGDLKNLRWKRFAAGMYEPFGLQVVDGLIYVTCKDRITRLHDRNDDGEADFYESFSADDDVSTFFHAFNFDLQRDKEGNFYYAKSGQYTSYKEAGSIIKISPDGKTREIVATGLRTPNGMGMMPDGRPTVSDNQGSWMPASKISLVDPGGFYGYVQTFSKGQDWAPDGGRIDHTKVVPPKTFDQPLIWMPQEFDNSSGGQLYVDDERWGPLSRRLLHTSFGKGWLYAMSVQDLGDAAQASIVKIGLDCVTGIHRARVNPADGQVYATGLNGWNGHGRKGLAQGGIHRFRYTGGDHRMLEGTEVTSEGILLRFNFDLAPEAATQIDRYQLEQWNYLWRSAYGSPQFKLGDDWEKGTSDVKIEKVELGADGRSVLLKIPDLVPVNQIRMKIRVPAEDGAELSEEVYSTINKVPGKDVPTMKEMTAQRDAVLARIAAQEAKARAEKAAKKKATAPKKKP